MSKAVVKGAGLVLVHTPDFLIHNGSTQVGVRNQDPNAEYLQRLPDHLFKFEETIAYPPNQSYIGNIHPRGLRDIPAPWFKNLVKGADRFGKYGEIMPQDEFYALIKYSDTFDLVHFTADFIKEVRPAIAAHPLLKNLEIPLGEGTDGTVLEGWIKAHEAEPLYRMGKLVGAIKQAHATDESLCAHVILENLAVKASGILAALWMFEKTGASREDIEYIIECSEEACGDINQRGGGNFAKAIGEKVGCKNATGSDTRGFCAAPTHAMINAAALVKAGVYKSVMVVAGGATAKLGMNGRDHVKKDMPVLEDVLGGFAFLVSEDDGVSPVINTDIVGRHTIATGSSPQAVMTSLIAAPLQRGGMTIPDVDIFSVEMQNPEITKPAGAGDVPEANYKMIGALGVMKKQIEKAEIPQFVEKHGMPGFAPTQGHIPSGVPYLGFAIDELKEGKLKNCMIVGKGSLFLGRMTNLFDGVSFLLEKNDGKTEADTAYDEVAVRELLAEAMEEVAKRLSEN